MISKIEEIMTQLRHIESRLEILGSFNNTWNNAADCKQSCMEIVGILTNAIKEQQSKEIPDLYVYSKIIKSVNLLLDSVEHTLGLYLQGNAKTLDTTKEIK